MLGIAIDKKISVGFDIFLIIIASVFIIGGCCGGDEGSSGGGWGGGWPDFNNQINDAKTTCSSLGGIWQNDTCRRYTEPQQTITAQVEDNEGKVGDQHCCKLVNTIELTIATIPDQNVSEDTPTWNIDLNQYAGGAKDSVTWNILSVDPALVSASISNNLLVLQLTPNAYGNTQLTVLGMNQYARTATQTIKLNVISVPDNPQIISRPIVDTNYNTYYEYQVRVFDPDSTFFKYNISQGPPGMSINDEGLLTWTPDRTAPAFNDLEIQVIDENKLKGTQTYTLRVWP
ncbi:MAG: hypothetical protein KJ601_04035 [Nanoarchaeota archaeon]|nr:hypothetical protein [Nanoarchaeota archaeon]